MILCDLDLLSVRCVFVCIHMDISVITTLGLKSICNPHQPGGAAHYEMLSTETEIMTFGVPKSADIGPLLIELHRIFER